MVLIIDDEYTTAEESFIYYFESVFGEKAEHKLPSECLKFIEDHLWEIDYMIIDENFDPEEAKIFKNGTELGRHLNAKHHFVPLLFYTAREWNADAVTSAYMAGFIGFIPKAKITANVIESNEGILTTISPKECFREMINEIKALSDFQEKRSVKRSIRKKMLRDELIENRAENDRLWKRVQLGLELRNYNLELNDKKIAIADWLAGYTDVRKLTEEELKATIDELLFSPLGFRDPLWQKALEDFREDEKLYAELNDKINLQALDTIIHLLFIERQLLADDKDVKLWDSYKLEKLGTSLKGKTEIQKAIIFKHKMIGRRVFIAFERIFSPTDGSSVISIDECISFLFKGHVQKKIKSKRSKFINHYLELNIEGNTITYSIDKLILEERQWLNSLVPMIKALRRFLDENFKMRSSFECFGQWQQFLKEKYEDAGRSNVLNELISEVRLKTKDQSLKLKELIEKLIVTNLN